LVANPAAAPLTPWSDPGRQTFGSWEVKDANCPSNVVRAPRFQVFRANLRLHAALLPVGTTISARYAPQ
jgi:hypothetical protein